jgi:hypothetical protein
MRLRITRKPQLQGWTHKALAVMLLGKYSEDHASLVAAMSFLCRKQPWHNTQEK